MTIFEECEVLIWKIEDLICDALASKYYDMVNRLYCKIDEIRKAMLTDDYDKMKEYVA